MPTRRDWDGEVTGVYGRRRPNRGSPNSGCGRGAAGPCRRSDAAGKLGRVARQHAAGDAVFPGVPNRGRGDTAALVRGDPARTKSRNLPDTPKHRAVPVRRRQPTPLRRLGTPRARAAMPFEGGPSRAAPSAGPSPPRPPPPLPSQPRTPHAAAPQPHRKHPRDSPAAFSAHGARGGMAGAGGPQPHPVPAPPDAAPAAHGSPAAKANKKRRADPPPLPVAAPRGTHWPAMPAPSLAAFPAKHPSPPSLHAQSPFGMQFGHPASQGARMPGPPFGPPAALTPALHRAPLADPGSPHKRHSLPANPFSAHAGGPRPHAGAFASPRADVRFPQVGAGAHGAAAGSPAFFRETPGRPKPVLDQASPFFAPPSHTAPPPSQFHPASSQAAASSQATLRGTGKQASTWPTPARPTSNVMSPHEQRDAIMSSPEARDEKEFWASPPAKTPRTERHQLLTPVKSGKKQPDDWWLKSPFKSEKGGRHGKFHEKVDFRSPGGFGKLASRFGDIQMLEHDAAPTAAVAGPASPARRGNLLFSDFLPAPSSPANHGQQAHQPGDFVALLMFPEAAAQDQPLPFELLCRVLAYLPPPDLVRCMVLSKSWCNAAAPALWSEIRVRSTVGWSKIFGVLKGKSTPASDASLFEDPPGSPRRSSRLASPARPAMPFGAHRRSGPRAAVYRSLVRAWSYSSIDADGKRLPTTRGATLSILRGLLTSRVYMPNLRRVSLAGGAEWADDGFLRMLAAGFGGVLEHLSLSGCRNVTRAALLASLPEFRALRSVRIEYSSEVDAAVVSRIAALGVPCVAVVYCGSLDDAAVALLSGCRELEVTFCPGVTFGAGIRGLLARAEGLEVLRAGYITWSEPPRGQTARFPRGMRELDLSGLPVLDARVSLPASLRRLVLRELPQAATAAALARLLKRCTSLEVLDVGGTPFAPGEREEAGRWCAGRGVRMVADD